ncbi:lipopolysaccharide biosynthesis protein [Sutcliffiella horikoshii]|uniref:lipopolysaccharide biosynthesis protein n=1 Tax=Sutcliffiella horikoshii TaxID=79883 RepID=UPI00384BEAE6
MKDKIIQFTKRPFIQNVIILSSGTAAAQIIGMLLSPIITRLYGPEAYGSMGTFMAIISIIGPVSALTIPIAIVLPKNNDDAKGLIRLSLLITTIISIVISLILLFVNDLIINIFGIEEIASYLYLIPIVILFSGLLQVTEQWLIRTNQFGISAKVTFLQAVIVNGGKVGVGFFYPIASVLILFSALTQGLKALLILMLTRKSKYKISLNIFKSKSSIKRLANSYKDFPIYRAPQAFLTSISEGFPILLLASFFGPASVGFYNIGRTVLSIPTQLIGKSVGDVFYPKISNVANNNVNNNDNNTVTKLLTKATLILIVIAIIPFGIIFIFGPQLFSFVFGSSWIVAGEYARWIGLWSFSSFILQPALRTLPVLSAQRLHLIYTIISLVIRVKMLAIGYLIFSSDIISIAFFGASSGLLNVILIFITIFISRRFDKVRENQSSL